MKFAPLFLFAILLGIVVSCGEKKEEKIEKTSVTQHASEVLKAPKVVTDTVSKIEEFVAKKDTTISFTYLNLSNQFDFTEFFTFTMPPRSYYDDSVKREIWIKDKISKTKIFVINADVQWTCLPYEDEVVYARSFITKTNIQIPPRDNYKGNLVIADFNFDGLEDIAFHRGCTVSNPGYYYSCYLQNQNKEFYYSPFLSEYMRFVPTKIDSVYKTLTSIYAIGAQGLYKDVVQLDTITNKWSRIKSDDIDIVHDRDRIDDFINN